MVVAELSIFPLDKGESLSTYVARVIDVIDKSGLDYRCHAMGTVVEGNLDEILDLVRRCLQELEKDCSRIEAVIKLDMRKGYSGRLEGKIASVEAKLGRSVRK